MIRKVIDALKTPHTMSAVEGIIEGDPKVILDRLQKLGVVKRKIVIHRRDIGRGSVAVKLAVYELTGKALDDDSHGQVVMGGATYPKGAVDAMCALRDAVLVTARKGGNAREALTREWTATMGTWFGQLEVLSRVDGASWAEQEEVSLWLADDEFWRKVITGPRKFCQHYDRLYSQSLKTIGTKGIDEGWDDE